MPLLMMMQPVLSADYSMVVGCPSKVVEARCGLTMLDRSHDLELLRDTSFITDLKLTLIHSIVDTIQ